jgi:integrase/recombinase XerD
MQTTAIYTRADPSVKLEALESVIAPKLRTGRFKATNKLMDLLKTAVVMRSESLRDESGLCPAIAESA